MKLTIGLAVAFAVGFVAGHYSGSSVFGYRNRWECVMAKAKEAGDNAQFVGIAIAKICKTYPM